MFETVLFTVWDNFLKPTSYAIPAFLSIIVLMGPHIVIRKSLPPYIKKSVTISAISVFIWIWSFSAIVLTNKAANITLGNSSFYSMLFEFPLSIISLLVVFSSAALIICIVFILNKHYHYSKKLAEILEFSNQDNLHYDIIKAWHTLCSLKPSELTARQLKRFIKYEVYLRILMGNLSGVTEKLDKLKAEDPAIYHFFHFTRFNMMGKIKDASIEIQQADESCNADTEPLIRIQILMDRGVGFVESGLYKAANDCFINAIDYGNRFNFNNKGIWEDLYYNYIFNKTRLDSNFNKKAWTADLDALKNHLDLELPNDYIAFSNIQLELLRQTNASRSEINELVQSSFDYSIRSNMPVLNRCAYEASNARIVCTGMLDPRIVLEAIKNDWSNFNQLPMPTKYNCFKQIDFLFSSLNGAIVEEYANIKSDTLSYISSQALIDLEEYRNHLPSAAIFDRCHCFVEIARLQRKSAVSYNWDIVEDYFQNAIVLYKANDLLFEELRCKLDLVDEAYSPINVDESGEFIRTNRIKKLLSEIESMIPSMERHPALAEVHLRMSFYYFLLDQYENCKIHYETYNIFKKTLSLMHYTPDLQRYYMAVCFAARILYFYNAVNEIISSGESHLYGLQIQNWLQNFYQWDGHIVSITLGHFLGFKGGVPIKECIYHSNERIISHAWLAIPSLEIEVDLTYNVLDYYKTAPSEKRLFFIKDHHPLEAKSALCLQKPNAHALNINTNVSNISPKLYESEKALLQIINQHLSQNCPSNEEIEMLYNCTMQPVPAIEYPDDI